MDNLCLREGPCPCFKISAESDGCVTNGAGAITGMTWSFTLQNVNLSTIYSIKTANAPPGVTVSTSPGPIPGGLLTAATTPVTITFTGPGVVSMREVCFDLIFCNLANVEICRDRVCHKLPCAKMSNVVLTCNPGSGVVIEFDWTNLSPNPVTYFSFGPDGNSQTIKPGGISYALPVAPGATAHYGPVLWNGPPIGGARCFTLALTNAAFTQCCVQKVCFSIPACPQVPPPPVNGPGHEPVGLCISAPGALPPPHGPIHYWPNAANSCIHVCGVDTWCHPTLPNTWILEYYVANMGSTAIDNLMFPDPNIAPSFIDTTGQLYPGQIIKISQLVTGAPGPYVIPIVATNIDSCYCCLHKLTVTLLPCPCLKVDQAAVCDPAVFIAGKTCYQLSFTVQNQTATTMTGLNFSSLTPGVVFLPASVPTGSVPPLGFFSGTVTVCVPTGVFSLGITYGMVDGLAQEFCKETHGIFLPNCCDCTGTLPPQGFWTSGLEQDAVGCWGLSPHVAGSPCMYFAKSAKGTVVRMDGTTGAVEGTYFTAPQTYTTASRPQRVHVDKYGECWVGNTGGEHLLKGSVMRVGCVIGGTRGTVTGNVFTPSPTGTFLKGPFAYLSPSVYDRNGDGYINTSAGLGSILPWDPTFLGTNNAGGISLAQDELVVNFTRVPSRSIMALAIDCDNNLWAGGQTNSMYSKVSGQTGAYAGTTIGMPRPWGGFINGDNNTLMSLQYGINVGRHPLFGVPLGFTACSGGNGVTLDPTNCTLLVSADALSNGPGLFKKYILRRFNQNGVLIDSDLQQDACAGLSVRRNGLITIARKLGPPGRVYHHLANGTYSSTTTGFSRVCTTAVDEQDEVWALDTMANNARQISPALTTSLGVAAAPTNQNSDHTGLIAAVSGCRTGYLVHNFDSNCTSTIWGILTWTVAGNIIGPNCGVKVEVRASNNPMVYPTSWTRVYSGVNFCGLGVIGQHLQIRVTIQKPACNIECNPKICNLTWTCCPAAPPDIALELGPTVTILPADNGGTGIGPSITNLPLAWRMERYRNFDPDDGATATWYIDGEPAGPPVLVGNVIRPPTLPLGEHTLDVVVQRGEESAHARTVVSNWTIDNRPPDTEIISGPDLASSTVGLSGEIPNVLPALHVTDNVSPPTSISVSQDPPAGTPVGPGPHPILITTQDAAGNIGRETFWYHVDLPNQIDPDTIPAVVSPGEPITLGLKFPTGPAVPLEPWWNCFPFDIVVGTGGKIHLLGQTSGTQELRLHFPDGNGGFYESNPILLNVLDSAPPNVGFTIASSPTPGGGMPIVKLAPPAGWDAIIEYSPDLRQGWTPFDSAIGNGNEISIPTAPVNPPGAPRNFFRALVFPHE